MMLRQIANPMPIPFGLVVTNGSKMRASSLDSMPNPSSSTDMIASTVSYVNAILTVLRLFAASDIDSQALLIKFTTTC